MPPIRRIVTGHDAQARAVVVSDEAIAVLRRPDAAMASSHIWLTDVTPADLDAADDGKQKITGTVPPDGGTRFGILDIAPGNTQHPPHRTDTVDYIICYLERSTLSLTEAA